MAHTGFELFFDEWRRLWNRKSAD